jgi:amidase
MRHDAALDRPAWSDVDQAAAGFRAGTLSPVRLAEEGLDRIARFDCDTAGRPGLRAVITLNPEARDLAAESERRWREGRPLSPLDGITVAIKDNIAVAALPQTNGSTLFKDWQPAADAAIVARLRAAGLIPLVKVSLDDFAGACFGLSSLRGEMTNPWDQTRMVGGSSGGSALAVAAGYTPLAVGTDTGGSLRIPAALTGVATLRPSAGRLPLDGLFPGSPTQDVPGPMAATVAGLAACFWALTGQAGPVAAHSRPAPASPAPGSYVPSLLPTSWAQPDGPWPWDLAAKPPASLRLGVVRGGLAIWGDDPGGPVLAQFEAALGKLAGAGVKLIDLEPPQREDLDASSVITLEARAAAGRYLAALADPPVKTFEELYASGAYTRWVKVRFDRDAAIDLTQPADRSRYEAALAARARLQAATATLFETHGLDAVVYPSVQRTAFPLGVEQSGVFTRWAENTGAPAVGLPMGEATTDGVRLPCSLELLGRPAGDWPLLAVAQAAEAALTPA